MPKLSEIINKANRLLDDTYDNTKYYDFIQEALDDLSSDLKLPTLTTLERNESGSFTLPDDFKPGDLRVFDSNKTKLQEVQYHQTDRTGYIVYGKTLELYNKDDEDTLTVRYFRLPETIEKSPDYVPDIPERYHHLLKFYSAVQLMLYEEEIMDDERYGKFLNHYIAGKDQLKEDMKDVSLDFSSSNNKAPSEWVVYR